MGGDLGPGDRLAKPQPDENPGRSDFAGWLAENGGITGRERAPSNGYKRRGLGTKFIRNQKPRTQARRQGCFERTSAADLAAAHHSIRLDGDPGDAGVKNYSEAENTEPLQVQDPMTRLIGSQRRKAHQPWIRKSLVMYYI